MLDGSALYDEGRMDTLEKRSDELYKELYSKEWFGKLSRYDRILGAAGEAVKEFYWNTAGEIEARDTAARRRMSAEERKNTPPDLGDADTVFADFDSVKYMSAEDAAYDAETAGIKEQLIQSQEKLNKMEVVSKKTVPENLRSKPQAAEWAINELKGKPDYVDRKGVGQVDVSQKAIRNAVKYADTPAEKAALVAAPDVIKRGIEIGGHDNHKSRGKSTMTIAAPVELNGQRGNMAVVINLRGNKYYAHRILTPDGAVFKFEHGKELKIDTGRESQRGVTVSGSLANATSSVSNNTIRSTAGNSQEKSSGKASVEVSGINSRTAAELNDGKRRRRTVGNTKRDIMQLFNTDRANRTDVERVLNRNIGEMMAQGEIRGDALDTLVNELLQTGSVVSSSKNSPWIDETYESIRSDLKGGKLYVSKDTCYELDAAEHYAKHALRNKDEDKELGDVYERVARQELDHCEMFHAQAVRLIREHGEAPSEAMRAVWEYEHDKIMERDAEIRVKLGLYDGR